MKNSLLWLNHVLITLFALSSGIFKLLGGKPDLEVFAHLGMGVAAVAAFGAVQALAGLGLVFARTARPAAAAVVACNALATAGLFAAGVQPFGVVSIAFIAMAALELKLGGQGALAIPGAPRAAPRGA
jgi:hypothetical protein